MAERTTRSLLRAAIRFNAQILGVTGGLLAALLTYVATHLSMSRWGDDAGSYLALLSVFFPGYSVTDSGAWIGAFWAFAYAAVFGWLSYWLYGKTLGARLTALLHNASSAPNPVLKPAVLRLHGVSLGIALGCTMSLGLFLSTAWLIVRGTAEQSTHAALLGNYLPGYSVSLTGALMGAVTLFGMVFLGCLLLAAVYNTVVDLRHGHAAGNG